MSKGMTVGEMDFEIEDLYPGLNRGPKRFTFSNPEQERIERKKIRVMQDANATDTYKIYSEALREYLNNISTIVDLLFKIPEDKRERYYVDLDKATYFSKEEYGINSFLSKLLGTCHIEFLQGTLPEFDGSDCYEKQENTMFTYDPNEKYDSEVPENYAIHLACKLRNILLKKYATSDNLDWKRFLHLCERTAVADFMGTLIDTKMNEIYSFLTLALLDAMEEQARVKLKIQYDILGLQIPEMYPEYKKRLESAKSIGQEVNVLVNLDTKKYHADQSIKFLKYKIKNVKPEFVNEILYAIPCFEVVDIFEPSEEHNITQDKLELYFNRLGLEFSFEGEEEQVPNVTNYPNSIYVVPYKEDDAWYISPVDSDNIDDLLPKKAVRSRKKTEGNN